MSLPNPDEISNALKRSGKSIRLDKGTPLPTGRGFQFVIQIQNPTNVDLNGMLYIISLKNDLAESTNFRFQVTTPPSHGRLLLTTAPSTNVENFMSQDISAGQLVYQHDGSPSKSDQFVVELMEKSPDAANAFQISMTPVQIGPVLQSIEPISVSVGGDFVLTQEVLEIVAVSAGPDELIFNASAPKHGALLNVRDDLKNVTSFSQQQVNDGEIVYRHAGGTPGVDSFEFDVYDPDSRRLGVAVFKIEIA